DHLHGLAPGQKRHERPWVVNLPLVLLAIPTVVIGYIGIGPMVEGVYFKDGIYVDAATLPALSKFMGLFHGASPMGLHFFQTPDFYLGLAGVVLSWFFYMKRPDIPAAIQRRFALVNEILENKYYFDKINEFVFAGGARVLGKALWRGG